MSRNLTNPYADAYVQTSVQEASPHRLIHMLMEGFLGRVAAAKGAIERGDIALKGESITKAIAIVGGLDDCLDMEKGGELASNLRALYVYMGERLLDANIKNDVAILDEVSRLMREIKSGWESIPEEFRNGVSA
ncbi:flagellar export chaperone FliS [Methylogaea oryzae]|nr:flagellar export chaperone FliS [Methylogaea oryzae]